MSSEPEVCRSGARRHLNMGVAIAANVMPQKANARAGALAG